MLATLATLARSEFQCQRQRYLTLAARGLGMTGNVQGDHTIRRVLGNQRGTKSEKRASQQKGPRLREWEAGAELKQVHLVISQRTETVSEKSIPVLG